MRYKLLLFLLFPVFVKAQQTPGSDTLSEGVHFMKADSWQHVIDSAGAANKYIFVDCYATWCAPCRQMDQAIYTNAQVGQFVNAHFISIKLQLDSTSHDSLAVKELYKLSARFRKQYHIQAFPTYLFFSPQGKIVHRNIGYYEVNDFLQVLHDALDPAKQYYSLLGKYIDGPSDFEKMPYLAGLAETFGQDSLAIAIAQNYLNNYLYHLPIKGWLTPDRIQFIASFTQSTKEPGFRFFLHNAPRIDSLTRKGYTKSVMLYLVDKLEVNPILREARRKHLKNVNWQAIDQRLTKAYGQQCAYSVIINAKMVWYKEQKNWDKYVTYKILWVRDSGFSDPDFLKDGINAAMLNNLVWEDIFLHSNNEKQLMIGIRWMKEILRNDPSSATSTDTYANLLYKIGNTKKAIFYEAQAVKKAPDIQAIRDNFIKMKNGVPTWPTNK